MIARRKLPMLKDALSRQASVALIGPRQVGKTTLALGIAEETLSLYLDLEASEDRRKLADPALFLKQYEERLVILDEIHRLPEIFSTLRGLIDQGRRRGHRTGRFLLLGSASIDVKRGLSTRPERGFYNACEDLKPARRFVVNSGTDRYPISEEVEAIGVGELASLLAGLGDAG
jgi:predicted AAA+ superfamily ATPase